MTITEFLNARYDEESAAASHAKAFPPVRPENIAPNVGAIVISPDRFLADIAAKRAIVALHGPGDEHTWGGPDDTECRTCADTGADEGGDGDTVIYANPESYPCQTARLLVQPYAEHADFDPAWRT